MKKGGINILKKPKCRICKAPVNYLFNNQVLEKYNINYYKCQKCQLIQTADPFWLKEAYRSAIVHADTGLLSRNFILSRIVATIIYFFFNPKSIYLDYAGGYGVFTRLMRDLGFDYYWDDPYAENIFAKGFDIKQAPTNSFEIITALEFYEHITNPVEVTERLFKKYKPKAILFTTMLYKEPIDKKWWYFAYESGQHISFYNLETLKFIAKKLKLNLYTNNVNIHLFTSVKISNIKFLLIIKSAMLLSLYIQFKLKSLTFSDHLKLFKKNESII